MAWLGRGHAGCRQGAGRAWGAGMVLVRSRRGAGRVEQGAGRAEGAGWVQAELDRVQAELSEVQAEFRQGAGRVLASAEQGVDRIQAGC